METLRASYQKALLAWLKTADSGGAGAFAALAGLRATLADIGAAHPEWQALAEAGERLFAAIADGRLPPALEYRRLAGRIEQLLRARQDEARYRETLAQLTSALPAESEETKTAPPSLEAGAAERKDPLSETLDAASSLAPLIGLQTREPRFTLQQRALWDTAVEALALAWEHCQGNLQASPENPPDWSPLRQAIFRLLEGALPLNHPAPLQLAEALASATDHLESEPPAPRLVTALLASLELLGEKDFLEHPALDSLTEQLVARLARSDEGTRSQAVDALFVNEAGEEIELLRAALEILPPDIEAMTESARRLQQRAEQLEFPAMALALLRFSRAISALDPAILDHPPGRDTALAWIARLEEWIQGIGQGELPPPPAEMAHLQAQLAGGFSQTGESF